MVDGHSEDGVEEAGQRPQGGGMGVSPSQTVMVDGIHDERWVMVGVLKDDGIAGFPDIPTGGELFEAHHEGARGDSRGANGGT